MGFSNSQLVGKPFPASSHWLTVSVAGSTQSFYLSPGYPGGFSAFFLPWSLFPVENVQLSDISIWLSIHIEQKLHRGCTTFVPCPFDPAYGCILICRCCSVQLCLTLCKPVDCSMPSFPVLHFLPELAQTHAHWTGDAIQPLHPLSPSSVIPSSFCFQSFPVLASLPVSCLFTSAGQNSGSASVLPMTPRIDLHEDGLVGSPCSSRDSQESFSTP